MLFKDSHFDISTCSKTYGIKEHLLITVSYLPFLFLISLNFKRRFNKVIVLLYYIWDAYISLNWRLLSTVDIFSLPIFYRLFTDFQFSNFNLYIIVNNADVFWIVIFNFYTMVTVLIIQFSRFRFWPLFQVPRDLGWRDFEKISPLTGDSEKISPQTGLTS